MGKPFLIISDTQIPFEHEKALSFVAYLKKHYQVPDDQIYHVGDEVDQLHGGMYPKDPDGQHTPNSEIRVARDVLERWQSVFTQMRVCVSNHGLRWIKKASAAEIPSQMIRAYQDVMGIGPGWKYQERWVETRVKNPFVVFHGMGLSGKTPYRAIAEVSSMSHVFGHLHSIAGMCHVRTADKMIWGFNVGSLIDIDSYAFKYGKYDKFKPNLGAGLVFNEGRCPIWVPLE